MKKSNPLIVIFAGMTLASCSSSRYIRQLPATFSYDEKQIRSELGIPDRSGAAHKPKEADVSLTDEELRIKEKYAVILGVTPEQITDYGFYAFIDQWLHTPYSNEKMLGPGGLNMVAFTQALYNRVFQVRLPGGSANEMFISPVIEKFIGRDFLEEGDLVFFRYSKDVPVGDVAVYLQNGKVLACTPDAGLAIFEFSNDYFQTRYLASGRVTLNDKPKTN